MNTQKDLGQEAIDQLMALWQVDDDRIARTENGFDWWPSRFRVSVAALPLEKDAAEPVWRVSVRTAVLKGVDLADPERKTLVGQFGSLSPSYAWVYTPREVLEKYEMEDDGTIEFQSSVYVRYDNVEWVPAFLGRMALLQAIDAHDRGELTARMLRAQLDTSGPSGAASADFVDDILGVAGSLYLPDGKKSSRWEGSDEFREIAERFGQSDLCYGNGGPEGLTLETPMGSTSALIWLRPNVPHPWLGNGLLATLQLPFGRDDTSTVDEAAWYNFFESVQSTNIPQLGSWHSKELPRGGHSPAHSIFVPNSLFQPGLATNLALWQVGRARWVRETFYPDMQDQTMAEILEARFAGMEDAE